MKFIVEFTTRAVKDLNTFDGETQKHIVNESLKLENDPFSYNNNISRLRGIKFPCYRLWINIKNDSIRLFYGIGKNMVLILRIVSKKDAEKVIKRLKK